MTVQTQFFTLWVFVLVCLAPITCKYINVLFLSTIVLLVGSYFSFIEPGFYVLDNGKVVKGQNRLIYVDLILHFIPWLFMLWYQGNWRLVPIKEHWRGTFLVVAAYLLLYPPWETNVYQVSLAKMGALVSISTLLYSLASSSLPVHDLFMSFFSKQSTATEPLEEKKSESISAATADSIAVETAVDSSSVLTEK